MWDTEYEPKQTPLQQKSAYQWTRKLNNLWAFQWSFLKNVLEGVENVQEQVKALADGHKLEVKVLAAAGTELVTNHGSMCYVSVYSDLTCPECRER